MNDFQDQTREPAGEGVSGETATQHTKRHWLRWTVGLLLVAAVVLALKNGYSKRQEDKANQVAPAPVATIKTATARTGSIGYYVEALGTVTPVATVNVYSQVTGRVTAVHYVEGQMVHKGDPLIDIDARPYEAQLLEAQGTLRHDQGLLKQAQLDLARYKEASDQQAIPRQTYEDQKQTVEQYEGTVQNDQGQVSYAQVQLSYCHLTSPINGRVGLRLVDPGNTIFSGSTSPLVVVTQLQPITVVFNVAEDDLDQVRGQITRRAPLPVDAYDRSDKNKLGTGHLLTLDNQIDTTTGTVRFRGEFANSDLSLYPNQFVNARLLVKTLQDAVLIPTAAVQRNGTAAFVYIVTGDTVKIRPVTELTTEGGMAAVTGVAAGEVVPVTGFDKLQEGTKVSIQSGSSSATATNGNPNSGSSL